MGFWRYTAPGFECPTSVISLANHSIDCFLCILFVASSALFFRMLLLHAASACFFFMLLLHASPACCCRGMSPVSESAEEPAPSGSGRTRQPDSAGQHRLPAQHAQPASHSNQVNRCVCCCSIIIIMTYACWSGSGPSQEHAGTVDCLQPCLS